MTTWSSTSLFNVAPRGSENLSPMLRKDFCNRQQKSRLLAERRLPYRKESSCTEHRRRITAKSYCLQSPFGVQSCTRVVGGLDVS
jgi:hypothetical protein